MKIIVEKRIKKNKKIIAIVKNNIAIRIAGKVSRYIDASMNRATPSDETLSRYLPTIPTSNNHFVLCRLPYIKKNMSLSKPSIPCAIVQNSIRSPHNFHLLD